jgi:predicted 3-demethylubiquinone-9 3-methyltransferase (glyoxalase superfamily)
MSDKAMHNLTTFLWFDAKAEEAARYYVSIFDHAEIQSVTSVGSANQKLVSFTIRGSDFMAIDGGPVYQLSPATSFMIHCDSQEEIDHYWEKLGDGGEYSMCGWLTDRYGVTWQVVPTLLGKLLSDPEKAGKVTEAFMKMTKFVIADLLKAAEG